MADVVHYDAALLPNEPLPESAPTPVLGENEHSEVYGLGEAAAIVAVRESDRDVSVRWHWSNTQDEAVASQFVAAIRRRHLKPEKKIVLRLAGTEAAVIGALRDMPVGSKIMVKPVDVHVSVPEGVTYRPMRSDEAVPFIEHVEENFIKQWQSSRPDLSPEQSADVARGRFKMAAPQGIETPGHAFIVIEEAGDSASKLAELWLFLNDESKESFCYDIEVAPEKRRMGYGRKTLVVWEHYAAQSGARLLGLNVFGTNTAARALYDGFGFTAKEVTYLIEE